MDALLVHDAPYGAPYGAHAGPKYGAYLVSSKTYHPTIYQPQVTMRDLTPFPFHYLNLAKLRYHARLE